MKNAFTFPSAAAASYFAIGKSDLIRRKCIHIHHFIHNQNVISAEGAAPATVATHALRTRTILIE